MSLFDGRPFGESNMFGPEPNLANTSLYIIHESTSLLGIVRASHMASAILSILFISSILGLILALILKALFAHIPGPPMARLTCLWLAFHARIGKRYQAVHEAHEVSTSYFSNIL
jgi:hypothetical protein